MSNDWQPDYLVDGIGRTWKNPQPSRAERTLTAILEQVTRIADASTFVPTVTLPTPSGEQGATQSDAHVSQGSTHVEPLRGALGLTQVDPTYLKPGQRVGSWVVQSVGFDYGPSAHDLTITYRADSEADENTPAKGTVDLDPEREVPECGDTCVPLGESCTLPSGHGGCHDSGSGSRWWYDVADAPSDPLVEPADITEEPPVEFKAGDRVSFSYCGDRITCTLVDGQSGLMSDTPDKDGYRPRVMGDSGTLATLIADVRPEPAPADVDPDEALGALIWDRIWGTTWSLASEDNRDAYRNLACAAREHIEAEGAATPTGDAEVERLRTQMQRELDRVKGERWEADATVIVLKKENATLTAEVERLREGCDDR